MRSLDLGVLGGSYVEGLSQKGYSCIGVDINEESIAYAKEKGWIVKGGSRSFYCERSRYCDFLSVSACICEMDQRESANI